jgi:Zn-dependent protease with chaperone function
LQASSGPTLLDSGRPIPRAPIESAVRIVHLLIGLLVTMAAIPASVGASLLAKSIKLADLVLAECAGLRSDASADTRRAAVSGRGFLHRLRFALVTVWSALALLELVGAVFLVRRGLQALPLMTPRTAPSTLVGDVVATGYVLDFLCGLKPGSFTLASRLFWGACATAPLAVVGVSVATLLSRWRTTRSALRATAAGHGVGSPEWLSETAFQLAAKAGREPPRIAVVPGDAPQSSALSLGFSSSQDVILLSLRTFEVLDRNELSALLGHELAHHVNGDCRRHNLLQLLGRITLSGDAFVGILEDSFGYELAADRTAVARLGVDPVALQSALTRMRAEAALSRCAYSMPHAGLPAATSAGEGDPAPVKSRRSFSRTILARFRLWVFIYTSDTQVAYWHPGLDERLRELNSLSDSTAAQPLVAGLPAPRG